VETVEGGIPPSIPQGSLASTNPALAPPVCGNGKKARTLDRLDACKATEGALKGSLLALRGIDRPLSACSL